MNIFAPLTRKTVEALAAFLAQPNAYYAPSATTDVDAFAHVLRPGDVILLEGNTRFAALVRRLTHSTWSHVAMFVGPLEPGPNPACIVEADVERGVRTIALSELRGMHARVLRATRLSASECAQVARRVLARIGQPYDLDCALALARALSPFAGLKARPPHRPAPGSHAESAICSTLLAQAFEASGYAILPAPAPLVAHAAVHAKGLAPRVPIPRDFDASPYFTAVSMADPRPVRA